jgi:rod shape-determining protein MreD
MAMAKKNFDFKPDKEGPDLLSRLSLTHKQRQNLLKWTLYGVVLLFLSLLQDVFLPSIEIIHLTTDLVPCAIITICIIEGAETGSGFALASSLVYLFSGSAAGIHTVPVLTFIAIGATIFRQSYLQKGFSATVLCVALAMMVYESVIFLSALMLGLTFSARYGVFVMMAVLSSIAAPLLYPILTAIGKIGGESWKE